MAHQAQTEVLSGTVAAESRRWIFARAVLDERTFELLINGEEVEIERKPFEVLRFLLQHAGEVVTKEELLSGVWPGRFLSDTVLAKAIGRLRDVLGDADQSIIKTVHGYGYRFIAPVRIEVQHAPEPAHFEFRPGDHPPGRPLWSLVRRLGAGGHGEAWLGQHDKTHEQRVFKFAIDEPSLGALKREITLFRFLNDSLGEHARIVALTDWNLEQPPCFIESEYIAGGSLVEWAERSGGLAKIPLRTRLDVAAQIAEALAAVHAVGVLHKDLKPSNVLIESVTSPLGGAGEDGVRANVRIRLADFGSGGVLDPKRLEALGITRLGFTKTVAALNATSGGTPLYLAPELLAGQPPTVKADIYALGVMLYQLVAGEFRKAMAPGWEHDLADELLRELIGGATQGELERRMDSASELAHQLKTLEQTRAERKADAIARHKASAAERELERLRARRAGMLTALFALVAGLVVSTTLYFKAAAAQRQAELSASKSRAVTEYLSKDVFAPASSGQRPVKDLTVNELLLAAGQEIDRRFSEQPDIARELHYVIGRALWEVYDTSGARPHFESALVLAEQLSGPGAPDAVRVAAELIPASSVLGDLRRSIQRYQQVLDDAQSRADVDPTSLFELRLRLARGHHALGDWQRGAHELEALLADVRRVHPDAEDLVASVQFELGRAQVDLARYKAAEENLRDVVERLVRINGPEHASVSEARALLAYALIEAGALAEAESQLGLAQDAADKWAPPNTWTVLRPRHYAALLRIAQGRPDEAVPLLASIVKYQDDHAGQRPEFDHTATVRWALGEAYSRMGRPDEAVAVLRRAREVAHATEGPLHPVTMGIRTRLANLLGELGRLEEAKRELDEPGVARLGGIPESHPYNIEFLAVRGSMDRRTGDLAAARDALRRAVELAEGTYRSGDRRMIRLRGELAQAQGN